MVGQLVVTGCDYIIKVPCRSMNNVHVSCSTCKKHSSKRSERNKVSLFRSNVSYSRVETLLYP